MLYDPYGSSENGVICLETEENIVGHRVEVQQWNAVPGGIMLGQGKDLVALDVQQVENLYQILKHNR